MKTGILAMTLAAVLGLGSAANACHKGHHHAAGAKTVKGKITSVGKKSFTLAVGTANHGKVFTINFNSDSDIRGVTNGIIDSSAIGDTVIVLGSESGTTIFASQIAVSPDPSHGKPAA